MDESKPDDGSTAMTEALAWCSEAVAEFQSALETLSAQTRAGLPDERSLAAFSRSWNRINKRRRRVEMLFADVAEIVEDIFDAAEAEKALREPGDSIPWEQVKAELGFPRAMRSSGARLA